MDKNKTIGIVGVGGVVNTYREGDVMVMSTDAFGADVILPGDAAKSPKTLDPEATKTTEWAPWGDTDDFGVELVKQLGLLGVARTALNIGADLHYGKGVQWFVDDFTEQGKIISKPVKVPDFIRLRREGDFDQQFSDFIECIKTFGWCVPVFIMDKGKTKVNRFITLDPLFTRIGKRDKKTGSIKSIFYSSKFIDGNPKKEDCEEIDIFDPENPTKHSRYALPIGIKSWGSVYYPEPDYYSVFRNGWAGIAITVPKFIETIYKYVTVVRYNVFVPLAWFKNKYKEWDSLTQEEQVKIFETERDEFNKNLVGVNSVGKTIISITDTNDQGVEVGAIKIEPIKNFLDSTSELPNNSAANSEILFAMGTDPSILGFGIPGGKNLSGSGSDKRESLLIKQATLERERITSYKLLRHIASQNKYYTINDELYPAFVSLDTTQTLDENPNGKQNVK